MKPAEMLHQMCHQVFGDTDLKTVCKARGFPPQAANSRGMLETLFLSSQGLKQAFASLDPREVAALHLLKTLDSVDVSFFSRIHSQGRIRHATFTQRHQQTFTKVKQRFVRAGLILLAETSPSARSKMSKLERTRFALPAEFHEHLPPLIPDPQPLAGAGGWNPDVCQDQMLADLWPAKKRPGGERVFQVVDGELRLHGKPFDRKALTGWQLSGWQAAVKSETKTAPKDAFSKRPHEAVLMILSELPEDHWAEAEQLAGPLRVFCGAEVDQETVCAAGIQWGLLTKQRTGGKSYYRLATQPRPSSPEQYLVADNRAGVVAVDLGKTPPDVLELIVAISDQRADAAMKGKLLVTPNLVKLGRADDALLAAAPAAWLVEHTRAFAEAFVTLGERRGKTILHENICVARVADLTLKVAIERALGGNLVTLKNDFVAFPRGSLDEVRRIVKKSGHVVKEASR